MVGIALLATFSGRGEKPAGMSEKYQEQSLALFNPTYDLDSPNGDKTTREEGHSLQLVRFGHSIDVASMHLFVGPRSTSKKGILPYSTYVSTLSPQLPPFHPPAIPHTNTHKHRHSLPASPMESLFVSFSLSLCLSLSHLSPLPDRKPQTGSITDASRP